MIKKMIFILVTIMFVKTAGAYTECVGGSIIKRNQYGVDGAPTTCTTAMCPGDTKTFCKSNLPMNWWSAFNWCKSNGGTLANFKNMCPGVATSLNTAEGACPALQKTGVSQYAWSSMGYGTTNAFTVNIASGGINHFSRNSSYYVLCE